MSDNQYAEMMARRRAAARSLEETVATGFIALDDAGRDRVAARLDDHFGKLAASAADRWSLVKTKVTP